MRRKITPIELVEAGADLPDLTGQQMEFVRGILAGKTATAAYREAYDCSNSTNNTIWCEASKLRSDPRVSQWVAAGRKAGLGHTIVTLQSHIAELERLKEIALETGNVGAAVQAEQLRGKATGHYTEQLSVKVDDPAETLKEIAKISPELAMILARDEQSDQVTQH